MPILPRLPASSRRTRRIRLLSLRWQRRALFVLGGIAVGLAAVGLALAADRAGELFGAALAWQPFSALLLTPAGFAASSWLARRYFPNSGGSGIPQAIAARQLHGTAARARLVSVRTALGKMVLLLLGLLLGLLCGASIGREGPTVQVGAAIMFALGRVSPRRQPGLILAGASAGVSAAFNTPLAGIVFGIEEMSRSFEARTNGIVLGAVIAAGVTSLALQGDYTYFGTTHAVLDGVQGWLAVPILGVLGGLLGGGFSRVLILFGTGYAQARALVQDGAGTPAAFGALNLLATAASSVSGIPGGIFAPSLAVGAGLGANVAALLPGAPASALVVLGMVAYFAGVVQAPVTAFVIVTEMTNDHALVLPLMLTSVIAYATSRLVCPEGVYHALAHAFVAAADVPGHRTPLTVSQPGQP